jgi:peroxiredoxin
MNPKTFLALLAALSLVATQPATAAEKASAKTELQELVGKVNTKLKAGQRTEKELVEELKAFDALLAAHKDEKTDDVAQILYMKAMLYMQVFDQQDKGKAIVQQMKKDFPETTQGKKADQILEGIEKQAAAAKLRASLVVGAKFPDFSEKDMDEKPLSIAGQKGKVVLVDFWATWCGPCIGELPNVKKAYDKYHAKGFEIIGISLDSDQTKLNDFIKKEKMSWLHYFDGGGWKTKLAQQYGINSIPATYLLDREGKIIASNLRGDALETELAKLLK